MPYVRPAVANAAPLLIKQIAAETAQLVNEGAKILALAQGTPNLPLFPAAVDAMTAHIAGGSMPYTDVNGLASVRATAAKFVNSRYVLPAHAKPVTAGEVMITAGAAQSVYNCLALSVGCASDVVLSPLPAYGLYLHQTNILGGTFDAIPTGQNSGFKPTVSDLEAAFSKHSSVDASGKARCNVRSIVLCFPNNPCGSTLTEAEARSIADFLDSKLQQLPEDGHEDFSVVLDEVYIGITAPGAHHSVLSYASPRLLRNCFLVLSVSKGLGAMPGARGGFLTVFDPAVIPQLIKVQMACTANAASPSQVGLAASLEHILSHPEALEAVYSYYKERTDLCVRRLNEIGHKYLTPRDGGAAAASSSSSSATAAATAGPIASCPAGTFYVMADFGAWNQPEDDRAIQRLFRDQYKLAPGGVGVACVPGVAFNLDPKLKLVRFSCAVELPILEQAMNIIEEAVRVSVQEK